MRVSVLSLNVWVLPIPLPRLRRRARTRAIRDALRRLDPDVVLLQELFYPPARRHLLDGVAPRLRPGPTAGGTRRARGLRWDRSGGLVTVSRFVVEREGFHPHEIGPSTRFDERVARKGVLVSHLRVGAHEVAAVNVHLHSGMARRDVESRRGQARGLHGLVRGLDTGMAVVAGGDFNERVRPPGVTGENGSPCLSALGFRDVWTEMGVRPPATYDIARNPYGRSWFNPTPVPAPFDRILVRDGDRTAIEVIDTQVVLDGPQELVSDHFGVLTILEVRPAVS